MACTCAGTAPGYPQHESGCGQVSHHVSIVEEEGVWFASCQMCVSDLSTSNRTFAEDWADRHEQEFEV